MDTSMKDSEKRVKHARVLLYGKRWWLNPYNWTYRRRVVLPRLIVLQSHLIVMITQIDRKLVELNGNLGNR